MAKLKHDSSGFLVGELIDTSKGVLQAHEKSISILRSIKRDVAAIRQSMSGGAGQASRAGTAPAGRPATVEPAGRTSSSSAFLPRSMGRTVEPRSRGADGRFTASVPKSTIKKIAEEAQKTSATGISRPRNTNGRFGNDQGGHDDTSTSYLSDKIGRVGDAVRGLAQSGEGLDPAITAMSEVKSVVEPLGRGAFAMLGRGERQEKKRWYSKILKALTLKKDPVVVGGGSGDGGGGVFAMLARLIGPVVAAIGPAILAALGVVGAGGLGLYIGTKIYEWLDKSGIATKIFDAFDSVIGWFKDKLNKVKEVKNDFDKGSNEVDRTRLNHDQFRRSERNTKFNEDGSVTPGDPNAPLAPSQSIAQSVGRAKGHVKNFLVEKAGYSPVNPGNDPTSPEYRARVNAAKKAGSRNAAKIRALQTGADYKAGNINGLNDAQTRALIASTSMTESAGGKLGIVNEAGYVGRYQAGAGWLAEAGHIKGGSEAVKAAMTRDGYKGEYAWGLSGGMTRFLKNDANWNAGMSYEKYMGSADIQDATFKKNSDAAYQSLLRRGKITADTPPEQIAGLLKARHLAGLGGASAIASNPNRQGPSDANGTSARKYFNDLSQDKHGFLATYQSAVTNAIPVIPKAAVPPSVPLKIPPAPEINIPALIPEKDRPLSVSINNPVGQNISDRTIAHAASGGIGAMYG